MDKLPASTQSSPLAPFEQQEDDDASCEPIIPPGLLPSYLAEAFSDLYGEDGLLVFGKGLGWLSLLAVFVRFYGDVKDGHASIMAAKSSSEKPIKAPLVLVLGLKDNERVALTSILESWSTPLELMPTVITNDTGQGKERGAMYQRGGVFIITSRILIVDLLSNVADARDIQGLLVAHADQVTEKSTEAFILRIFHSQKLAATSTQQDGESADPSTLDYGFVKAFTDAPDSLMAGFANVDKILKSLRVRRLYLYPRFHHAVRRELEAAPPNVDELHQELSPLMKEIQNAIAAAVQGLIRELKKSTSLLDWNAADLSVENCVTTQFDRTIRRQLEQDWHRLRPQTKQLVHDLKTLRTLFQALIQYDCVAFWKLINSIKTMSAASRNPSMWLVMPAADMMFRKAKERIYTVVRGTPSPLVEKPVSRLKPVLEETPKWRLLKQVLGEVEEEEREKREKRAEEGGDEGEGPVTVLVMIKDEKSLEAIRSYLTQGRSRSMMHRWLRYLEGCNDRSRSIADMKGGTSAISEESRLLLEEEGRVRRILFGSQKGKRKAPAMDKDTRKPKKQLNEVPDYMKKRRRIATEKGRGEVGGNADDLERQAVLDEAVQEVEQEMDIRMGKESEQANDNPNVSFPALDDDDDDRVMYEVRLQQQELRVVLKSHSNVDGDEATLLLQDIQPSYIVLYHANVSFIRAIEVYSALSSRPKNDPIKVYFLVFEASAEEKIFLKDLEREQNAFERLIHHKTSMTTQVFQNLETQEMQQAQAQGTVGGSYANGTLPLAYDTRQGRGKAKEKGERRDIAVDVREFRSALPSILHQGGMRIAPVTLAVGDFVLSSVHCVERKAISDLFGSFASGRLFTQCTEMTKYYKVPCLLIEFDPNKSFCLQNSNELGVEIRNDSVCSKMVLLTMSFPSLRILWSRSPHHTLEIFKELKTNHDEVDVEKAIEVGKGDSEESFHEETGNADDDDEINEMARGMLLRLPGVNLACARRIIEHCDTLAELSAMTRDQLRQVAGPTTGQKLFTFFRQKLAAT